MFERIRIGFFTLKKPNPIRQARKNDPACFFYDLASNSSILATPATKTIFL